MRNKDFAEIARHLLPGLPGFAVKTPLILFPPVNHTLRGICFESHSYEAKLFYVWVFFLPLFVPRKHLSFEFGKRVGSAPWNADAVGFIHELGIALKNEAVPFISPIESPNDVAQAALSLPQNPHVKQAIAYALARAGAVDKALAAIEELASLLDVNVPWQLEISKQSSALKVLLLDDPPAAQEQLNTWESESVHNLGLEKFR